MQFFVPATLCLKHPELQNTETKSSRHSKKISSHKSNCLCCFSLPFWVCFWVEKETWDLESKILGARILLGLLYLHRKEANRFGHRFGKLEKGPRKAEFFVL